MKNINTIFDCRIEKEKTYEGVQYIGTGNNGKVKIKCHTCSGTELKFDIIKSFILYNRTIPIEISNINTSTASCDFRIGKQIHKDSSFIIKGEDTMKIAYEENNRTRFFTLTKKDRHLILERTVSGNYCKIVVDTKSELPQSR